MENVKVGFLPLYLELYDDIGERERADVDGYCDAVFAALAQTGIELVRADVCRIAPEVKAAVARFEAEQVDAIITLHLAYSPSLESIDAMAGTNLPILILDTTRDFNYGFDAVDDAITFNHGIHGVQDFCNLLRRRGKQYSLFVGHYTETDVVKRVTDAARAVKAAKCIKGMKVGQIGGSFKCMGDFLASKDAMARLGVETVVCDGDELVALRDAVSEEQIRAEYESDCAQHGASAVTFEEYACGERVSLAIRQWIKNHGLGAFTMNFLAAGKVKGFDGVAFDEASKAMSRGIGYAGEGDVLTASLVGALAKTFDKVNFTEMFCPDWKGDAIYMSHMGESNVSLLENRKTMMNPLPYIDCLDFHCIFGHMVPGKACVVNLLPNAEDWFDMVICQGEMLQLPEQIDTMIASMNGWFKPNLPIATLLEKYSEAGGTHHSALVYDVDAKSLALFAKMLGIKCTIL